MMEMEGHSITRQETACNEDHSITWQESACNEDLSMTPQETACNEVHLITRPETVCNEDHLITRQGTACNEDHSMKMQETACNEVHAITRQETACNEDHSITRQETARNEDHSMTTQETACNEVHSITRLETACNEDHSITRQETARNEDHSMTTQETACNEVHSIIRLETACNEDHSIARQETACNEDHSMIRQETASNLESSPTCTVNCTEENFPSMGKNSSEEKEVSENVVNDHNIDGKAINPVKDTMQNTTDKQISQLANSTVDEVSKLPIGQFAEAGILEAVGIKEEQMDYTLIEGEDFPNANDLFAENEMFENYPVKKECVKSERDDRSSDGSSSDQDDGFPWDDLLEERQSFCGNNSRNLGFSNELCNANGAATNGSKDGSSAEQMSSKANDDSRAAESNMEDRENSAASPDWKKCRRLRRKKAEDGSAYLEKSINTREKRSAFKKCTEWFKHLTGEMGEKYSCFTCNAGFASKRKLREHELVHKPTNLNKALFQTIKVMSKRLESDNGKLSCTECNGGFSTKSALTKHQIKCTGMPVFTCHECSRRFSKKQNLIAHMRTIHSDKNPAFPGKVTMLQTPVSRVRKFKCNGCDARFTQMWSLEQHQLIHNKEIQEFECKECGKKFTDVSLLAKHQESHVGQKSYGCGECAKRFTQKSILFKHQLSHVERRKVECSDCNSKFSDRSELKIHYLMVHGTENLCVCTVCNKTFSRKAALKRHLVTHSGKKPFQCSICKEIFAQKSTLTRHALLHGGEQFYRFICSVCDRKFSRRETLTDHMRTHTGERPFVCAVCHEGFTQKSAMRRHQILHFKERRGKNSLPPVEVDTGTTDDILLSLVYSGP